MIIREANIFDHTGIMVSIIKWIDESSIAYPVPNRAMAGWVNNVLEKGYCVVAEEDGRIVGTMGMTFTKFPWNDKEWIMNNEWLHVDIGHRKGGTARKILDKVLDFAKEKNIPLTMGIINGVDLRKKERFMKMTGALHLGGNFAYGLGAK